MEKVIFANRQTRLKIAIVYDVTQGSNLEICSAIRRDPMHPTTWLMFLYDLKMKAVRQQETSMNFIHMGPCVVDRI